MCELFFSIALVAGLIVCLRSCWPASNRRYDLFLVWGAPILGLFICVYVFKSEIRFRVPFDVYFIPLAVRGWMSIIFSSSPAQPGESRLTPSIN